MSEIIDSNMFVEEELADTMANNMELHDLVQYYYVIDFLQGLSDNELLEQDEYSEFETEQFIGE